MKIKMGAREVPKRYDGTGRGRRRGGVVYVLAAGNDDTQENRKEETQVIRDLI